MATTHKVSIYQIEETKSVNKLFQSYASIVNEFGGVKLSDYKKVYNCNHATMESNTMAILDEIFTRFNVEQPKNYKGRSISVSDIIVLDGVMYYVDKIGFQKIDIVM